MRFVFLHGNGGSSGSENWFPSVAAALRSAGYEALTPDLPDPVLARAAVWLPFLERELHVDDSTVLVGHSSGAVAALRYAQTHRIAGAALVGAYCSDLGMEEEKQSGYFDGPWPWETIRSNSAWISVFASPEDPYIPIEEPRALARHLSADYVEMPGRGHFSPGDGADFPELAHWLLAKAALRPGSAAPTVDRRAAGEF